MWTRKETKGKERKARKCVDTLEVLLHRKMSEI